ncbi:hypothetical protein XarbCFBP8150_08585 [Xanthomonas arboricola]|nr:hypothetical protein XarbCFBP8150_08585 [Xanthomonas arboricola]
MIMNVVRQLLTPARYLRIRSETSDKFVIDFVFPAVCALVTTGCWAWRPDLLSMRGPTGVLSGVSGLMQILVGFYVATLAAVATFPTSSLDENTNRIWLGMKGGKKVPLKRRRFLAYLFGYLAMLSLALVIALLFRPVAEGALLHLKVASVVYYVKLALVFIYQFIFWQMVFITLLGLYYLTDRIHRSNNE